jgi:hypothetical protein
MKACIGRLVSYFVVNNHSYGNFLLCLRISVRGDGGSVPRNCEEEVDLARDWKLVMKKVFYTLNHSQGY